MTDSSHNNNNSVVVIRIITLVFVTLVSTNAILLCYSSNYHRDAQRVLVWYYNIPKCVNCVYTFVCSITIQCCVGLHSFSYFLLHCAEGSILNEIIFACRFFFFSIRQLGAPSGWPGQDLLCWPQHPHHHMAASYHGISPQLWAVAEPAQPTPGSYAPV